MIINYRFIEQEIWEATADFEPSASVILGMPLLYNILDSVNFGMNGWAFEAPPLILKFTEISLSSLIFASRPTSV